MNPVPSQGRQTLRDFRHISALRPNPDVRHLGDKYRAGRTGGPWRGRQVDQNSLSSTRSTGLRYGGHHGTAEIRATRTGNLLRGGAFRGSPVPVQLHWRAYFCGRANPQPRDYVLCEKERNRSRLHCGGLSRIGCCLFGGSISVPDSRCTCPPHHFRNLHGLEARRNSRIGALS